MGALHCQAANHDCPSACSFDRKYKRIACSAPLFAALFQASMSLYDQHIQAVNTRTSSEWALDKIVHLHEEIFRALEAFDLPACSKVLDDHYSEMDCARRPGRQSV